MVTKQDLFIWNLVKNNGEVTTREMMDLMGETAQHIRVIAMNLYNRNLILRPEIIKSNKKPYRMLKFKINDEKSEKIKWICSKF